jgi:hypothetical protein
MNGGRRKKKTKLMVEEQQSGNVFQVIETMSIMQFRKSRHT